MSDPLSVVIGEDDVLLREGIARLLAEAGFDVVAQAGDADDFLRRTLAHRPDVAVVDVQMPPRHEDDGLRAALQLRTSLPDTGILVLSQFYEETYALDLIGERPEGVGYLLKERVGDVSAFVDAVQRVAAGGSALDPEVVGRMLGRRRAGGPLDDLTPREREVLAAMAEGKSNSGIAEALVVSEAAVEKHVGRIFGKLGLGHTTTEHRRVLAVLTYLRGAPRHQRLYNTVPADRDPRSAEPESLLSGLGSSRTMGTRRPPAVRLDRPKGVAMLLKHNRVLSVLAATSAALALGAAPALAGENDDDGDDDDESTQIAPAQSSGSASSAGSTVPQGGVATGAGGMADQGPGGMLAGLASGALVLIATGGGLVAVARRGE